MLSDPFVFISHTGYITFFFEIFVLQFLFMRKVERRSYFALRLVAGIACSVAFVWLPPLSIGVVSTAFFVVLIYAILMALLCFKANVLNCVFYGLTAWAVQHSAWSIYLMFCLTCKMSAALTIVVYFLTYAVVYTAAFFAFSFGREESVITREKLNAVLVSVIILFITTILYDLATYNDKYTVYYLLYAFIACLLVLFVQFGITSREQLRRKAARLENEKVMLEGMLYRQNKQQKLTNETVEIINRKCHDLKHQISLLRDARNKDGDRYLDEMEKAVMVYGDIAKTGNYALDITLTEKCLLCEEHGIKFTYMVDGESLDMMRPVVVSSLFGNILDNAIESADCEEEGKRIIRLNVAVAQGHLRIHCENYCSAPVRFSDGLPVSDRAESGYHGFGTKSIRFIVEQYGGNVVMGQEDDMFNVNIILPVK